MGARIRMMGGAYQDNGERIRMGSVSRRKGAYRFGSVPGVAARVGGWWRLGVGNFGGGVVRLMGLDSDRLGRLADGFDGFGD